ncbi:MAG TPA: hypothetical protein PK014_12230 [Thermoanaerobaculia bacterium]|nr:hypothetical protein [Thermoanaerobaculia bacterium]HUM30852.1 hypothetical protein [Thermoanaerobaculia bacterium]HXK69167.1 hypothetical protein [Thermoanaerobaculia bacterium]
MRDPRKSFIHRFFSARTLQIPILTLCMLSSGSVGVCASQDDQEGSENTKLRTRTALGQPLIQPAPHSALNPSTNSQDGPGTRADQAFCFYQIDPLTGGCDDDIYHDEGEVLVYDVAFINNDSISTGEFYADIQVKSGSDPNGYVSILTSTATFPDTAPGNIVYAVEPFIVQYSGPKASTGGDLIQLEVVNVRGAGWTSACGVGDVVTLANLDVRGTPAEVARYSFDTSGDLEGWSSVHAHGSTSPECSGTYENGEWVQSDARYINNALLGHTCTLPNCGSTFISHSDSINFPGPDYFNYSDEGLLSPSLDFSADLVTQIGFYWWAYTEVDFDGFIVEGSRDDGSTWEQMALTPDYSGVVVYSGDPCAYYAPFPNYGNNGPTPILFGDGASTVITGDTFTQEYIADFSTYLKESTVRIRFRNSADSSNFYMDYYGYYPEGIYVDEVRLLTTVQSEPDSCSPSPDLQFAGASLFDDSTYCGDNAILDPGDTGPLYLYLENIGNDVAENVTATLACPTCPSGVTICDDTATYGMIPFGSTLLYAPSSDTFSIAIEDTVACNNASVPMVPTALDFELTLQGDSYGPVTKYATVTLGGPVESLRYEDHFAQAPDGTLSTGRVNFSTPGWTEIYPLYVGKAASADSDGIGTSAQVEGQSGGNGFYRIFSTVGADYGLTVSWDWNIDNVRMAKYVVAQYTTNGSTWNTIRQENGYSDVGPGWTSYSVDLVSEFGAAVLDNSNFGIRFYSDTITPGYSYYVDNIQIVGTTHTCSSSPCNGGCPDGCDEPTGLAMTTVEDISECDDTGVTIQWTLPSAWGDGQAGGREVMVYRYDDSSCSVNETAVTCDEGALDDSSTECTDNTSPNNTDYYYKIETTNRCGKLSSDCYTTSARDNYATEPDWTGISDVQDLDDCVGDGVRITWATPSAWNDGGFGSSTRHFELFRYSNSGCTTGETLIDNAIGSATTYYDYDAPDNTQYFYKVRAVNQCDKVTESCSTGVTDYQSVTPDVQNVQVADDDNCVGDGVTISWDSVADWGDHDLGGGSRHFDVYRYTDAACAGDSTHLTPSGLAAASTSYQDNPTDNTAVYYKLVATNRCGTTFETCLSAVTDWASSNPTGMTASAVDTDDCDGNGVTISWTAPSWNDNDLGTVTTRHFDIYRYTDSNCSADEVSVVSDLGAGETSYTLHNPPDNQVFYYKVVATNKCGDTQSACTSGTNDKASTAPTWAGVSLVEDDDDCIGDGITITWPAPSDWGDNDVSTSTRHFEIYRYTDASCTQNQVVINANVASNGTSLQYDPADNQAYYYQVVAVNGCDDSTPSCYGSAVTDYASSAPAWAGVTTVFDTDDCAGDGVTVQWATPSNWNDNGLGGGSRHFDIYRYTSAACGGTEVEVITGLAEGTTSYALHDPPDNSPFYYKVVATNACGDSLSSCYANPVTDYIATNPSGLQVNVSEDDACNDTGISISWSLTDWGDNNVGFGNRTFDIYRYTDAGCSANETPVVTGLPGTQFSYAYDPPNNQVFHYKVVATNKCVLTQQACSSGITDYQTADPTWTGVSEIVDLDDCIGNGIGITWSTPSDWGDNDQGGGTRHFEIYGYTNSGCSAGQFTVNANVADTETYLAYNATDNTAYYYKVVAVNACGSSVESCHGTAVTDYASSTPTWAGVTTVFDTDECAGDGVTIQWATPGNWNDNGLGSGSRQFDIYRYDTAGCGGTEVVVVTGLAEGATSYALHDPPDNTAFYYKVVATNACGDSLSSCYANPVIDYISANPSGLQVNITNDDACNGTGLTISWTLLDWGDNDVGPGNRTIDIYRYSDSGCSADETVVVAGLAGTESSYPYDPPDNQTFYYKVILTNKCSLTQQVCSGAIVDYQSTDPTWGGVTAIGDLDECLGDGVGITWRTPSDWGDNGQGGGTRHFEIYGYTDSGCSVGQFTVNANVADTETYLTYDATDNAAYYYKVVAVNACGGNVESCYGTAVTDEASSSPTGMTIDTITDDDDCLGDGITINWNIPSDWKDNGNGSGTRHFDIYGYTDAGCSVGQFPVASDLAATTQTYGYDPTDNTTFYYQVVAVNACGDSEAVCSGGVVDVASVAPSGWSITGAADLDTCDDTGVQISWSTPSDWGDHGSGTAYFELYRYDGAGCTTGETQLSADASSPFTDNTGDNNTSYSYKIVAVNGCGTTASACSTAISDNVSYAPAGLSITEAVDVNGCADTGVRISWDAPSDWGDFGSGSRHYEVYRYDQVGCAGSATLISDDATSPVIDTTGTNGTDYYYKVIAYNGCGDSSEACSGAVADTLAAPPDAPSITDLSDLDPAAETGVQITWSHSGTWGDNLVSPLNRTFSIYRYDNSSCLIGQATVVTGLASGTTQYVDTNGVPNQEYYYKVVAVNSCGQTAGSTCEGPVADWIDPGEVENVHWTDKTTLTWNDVTYAKNFNVYRGIKASLPDLKNANYDSCLLMAPTINQATGLTNTRPAGDFYWFVITAENPGQEGDPGFGRIVDAYASCPMPGE